MNKTERIYLHKEDVWTEGEHWMSSASRDIFEHFYKAIRSTFMNRYKNPTILECAENIVHQRLWSSNCFSLICESAKNKTGCNLPVYTAGREKFPEELEYFGNEDKVHHQVQGDFDEVIYKDFEHFFLFANHGYGKNEESRKIVFDLYFNFMKPYSKDQLLKQLELEHQESLSFLNEMMKELQEFNNQKEYAVFHKFALRNK